MNLRVKATTDRYGFDGQTGIVVLEGTSGTVTSLELTKKQKHIPTDEEPVPTLTVYWDYALVQDAKGKDFAVSQSWEECDVRPDQVVYLGVVEDAAPAAATVAISVDTWKLCRVVAEDAEGLIECNCSVKDNRCDGTCTHSMATRVLAQLDAAKGAAS